jgi:hypothetical protein
MPRHCFDVRDANELAIDDEAYGEKSLERLPQRNDDLRPDLGEPAPMASNCASPSCARAPASPVSGIPPHGREGAHRRGAESLCAGRLDPLGGRLVQAMGMTGISKKQLHEQTSDARITLRG